MKKSIFLLFAAILCAMSVSANMVYLKPGNWLNDGADVWVHSWGGTQGDVAGVLKPVGLGLYGLDIKNNTSCLFVRQSGGQSGINWGSNWYKTGDLKIESGQECYHVSGWDVKGWIAVPSAHIAGDEGLLGASWDPANADNKMTKQDDGTYTLVKTVTLEAKTYYFKVTDGTWDWALGDPNASNNDKNAELTISEAGEHNVTFTYNPTAETVSAAAEKVEAEEPETPVEPTPDPEPAETETVYFVNAEDWAGTIYAYAWTDGTPEVKNHNWPGVAATKEANKIGGHDVYSYTAEKGKYAKVIFNNNSSNQTSDMTWTAGQYICKNEWFVDEAAVLAKLNGPVEYVSVYFINTVKWSAVNIYTWSPEVKSWPGVAMTKEAEQIGGFDVYSYTVEKGTTFGGMKFNAGNNQPQTGDLQWTDGKYYIYNYGEVVGWFTKEEAEAKLAAPIVTYDYYIAGTEAMTGHNWNPVGLGIEDNDGDGIYSHTFTLNAGGDYQFKVTQDSDWDPNWGYSKLDKAYDGVTNSGDDGENIKINLTETKTITVHFDSKAGSISLEGLDSQDKVTYDYYIAGTLPGAAWNPTSLGMTKEDDVYKATFSELNADTYEFKITDGQWNSDADATHEHTTLGAAYEEVSYNEGNIQIVTEEAINLTVIFNAATDKITFEGLTEKAPAEPVTVYFINSGNWAEVACYYWGGIEAATWPGAKMTANGEVFEAEGWNVYKITFPGDNTKCIFTDNKAEGATQTADLQVENGKYYCYANGIWYERLADVDPLDTRVYLKGQMNEWCDAGYCYMFRKETIDGTVAYSNVYLEEAHTTYEFKIEDAGAWLSNTGTMTKDNCTDWTFEESVSDNAKITTEYVGEYTFVWDMTTKKLSVVYPDPKANPEVMDLMVTDMVFDGNKTFSGTDNMMGIVFNLVVGDETDEEGVFALDASSTVNFGGTLFTDVTGMIAPDTETFASASAVVYGFYMGMYCQLNVEMSAGGAAGVSVEILDGTASVNGAGELWITGQWEGDDVYVQVPGFEGESYECDEAWFYVGGTTVETASIIAFGPVTITVEGNDVTVEGTVMSGATFTSYDLLVIGTFPAAPETYTRTVTNGQWGTICLPNASSSFTGATFYEVSSLVYGEGLWLDKLAAGAQLVAGKPYIFQATATEIVVTYTGAAVGAPIEGANGLTGTFEDIEDGSLDGHYIIANNAVYVAGAEATLPANRAYINAEDVPTTTQAEIPGRRRVLMGENAATGVDNIVAPEGQAVKAIVNGQLIIIRDGVKYNVQGQKL